MKVDILCLDSTKLMLGSKVLIHESRKFAVCDFYRFDYAIKEEPTGH